MNFIVVEGTLANTKKNLLKNKTELQSIIKQNPKSEYIDKLNLLEGKLKAIQRYEGIQEKRTQYSKIKNLKLVKPKRYIRECRELCRGVSGVSFRADRLLFVVQKTVCGRKRYAGSFDDFDDATESLDLLISNQ